ncbi:MAG TPA: carbohydrate ABC transporter permease [Candidatus Limnocylindrales bacterium]|nr:carbohydrate ABC transporter permease [Candidatus Limnocylindrales bacterium]
MTALKSPTAEPTPLRVGRLTLMIGLALFFVFPIVFMLVSSLKPDHQLLSDTSSLRAFLPIGDVSLDNYVGVFERVPALQFLFNSIVVTGTTVALGLVVNSMAGFAIARMRWTGQRVVLTLIIATLIVPFETIAIPLLLLVSKLPWIGLEGAVPIVTQGWLNSLHVQIIPFIANAFSIFLFVQYFKSLPVEIDEAARVDGAGWFQIYRRIVMPLSGPVIATVAILTFLPVWNAYLWPLMVTQSEAVRPVMVGVQYFFQLNVAWGEVMAYLSMITLPVLALFLALQRAFIESIAASGVKG